MAMYSLILTAVVAVTATEAGRWRSLLNVVVGVVCASGVARLHRYNGGDGDAHFKIEGLSSHHTLRVYHLHISFGGRRQAQNTAASANTEAFGS